MLKEYFEDWMRRIMERFDRQDGILEKMVSQLDRQDEMLEKMVSGHNMLEGERLLDNQDICRLLNISKRTLQRFRSSGELPYQNIYHKTYYKQSDVETFILMHFEKEKEGPDE